MSAYRNEIFELVPDKRVTDETYMNSVIISDIQRIETLYDILHVVLTQPMFSMTNPVSMKFIFKAFFTLIVL